MRRSKPASGSTRSGAYLIAKPGRAPAASRAVRRFLGVTRTAPGDFAAWAGLAKTHAARLWDEVAGDLVEVEVGKATGWLLREDLWRPRGAAGCRGIRLLPPGDPYLQAPNRPLLGSDPELRKRLFRPVASPGAVLKDGRLTGLWRVKARERPRKSPSRPSVASRAGISRRRLSA